MTQMKLALTAWAGSVGLLGGAFIFQLMGYAPCAMCLWQRWPHGAAIVIGLLFVMTRQRLLLPLGAIAAAVTSGIGFFHTGVERDWWPGPQSCTSNGGLSASEALLPSEGGATGLVLCDEVVWDLFGLSMATYNGIFSAVFALLWLMAALRKPA